LYLLFMHSTEKYLKMQGFSTKN